MWQLVGGLARGDLGREEEEWSERNCVEFLLQPGPQTALRFVGGNSGRCRCSFHEGLVEVLGPK